jgi:signal transduction histidine kinase
MNGFSKIFGGIGEQSPVVNAAFSYSSVESVNNQVVCLMRVLLTVAALVISFIDQPVPDRFVYATYLILISYCLYSLVLYFLARRESSLLPVETAPWIDVAVCMILISLSNGSSSIFFFFTFFAILVASFRSGFITGIRLTFVSALLFTLIGYFTAQGNQTFELNRFLIRPVYLLLLGYMISYWGGQEIKSKRQLVLLKDINRLSNPRFGVNRTLSGIINQLRAFYDADSCILISFNSEAETYNWREAKRDTQQEDLEVEQTQAAAPLINLLGELAVLHQSNSKSWYQKQETYAYDPSTGKQTEIAPNTCTALADLLETESFLSVPIIQRGEMIGRLYLTSNRNCFEHSEIEFISQLSEQVIRAVENVELLNRLATGAAGEQRQKISRDLHDTTIQPYVGLKLGLEALEIKHASGAPIGQDIEKLVKLTDSTIADLRGYVSNLKSQTDDVEGNILIKAVKQQAIKFQEFYNINVTVEASDNLQINDRLAAEAFQIVSEGLSNIKRHTKAKNATIRIYPDSENLFLEIENDNEEMTADREFTPKSITGRAKSLGGSARVEKLLSQTKVLIEIPL